MPCLVALTRWESVCFGFRRSDPGGWTTYFSIRSLGNMSAVFELSRLTIRSPAVATARCV